MYLDVSPARLTWSILRAASSPVHENMGYWAQPTCSCKFFILSGCEKVKRVSYTFSSSSMDVEWLMPKAAPALTSQLVGPDSALHTTPLPSADTSHGSKQWSWSSWAAGANMGQYDHGWFEKLLSQPSSHFNRSPWIHSPHQSPEETLLLKVVIWLDSTLLQPNSSSPSVSQRSARRSTCSQCSSSSARCRCTQVYPRCHITLYPWQNHPAAADGGQDMLWAPVTPHLQHTDHT